MQNDLVLSDLGRTVTSITDGANDRYLSAKRVYQSSWHNDISASDVPIRVCHPTVSAWHMSI